MRAKWPAAITRTWYGSAGFSKRRSDVVDRQSAPAYGSKDPPGSHYIAGAKGVGDPLRGIGAQRLSALTIEGNLAALAAIGRNR
jgi:hypothetical protein